MTEDNVDAAYYWAEADRCRWLAQRADTEAASILHGLASGYEDKAAKLGAAGADPVRNELQRRRA